MTKFQILASISGAELYQNWAYDEVSLWTIVYKAFQDGVTYDDEEQPEERLLNHVMGILPNGYIVTYDKDEDIIDIWKQLY
jgi:hypothetical protein